MPATIRFYADEHIAKAVARGLRRRGVDVLTAQEAGLIKASDDLYPVVQETNPMSSAISPLPLPPDAEVEISVRIHTPLNVTRLVARQKVNVQLTLHCGQSFVVEEPELQIGDRVCWRVPIWVTHPTKGRVACLGDVRVDAQTGEVLCTREQLRLLKGAANGVLQALDTTP